MSNVSLIDGHIDEEKKIMRDILFRGKRVDNGEWVYGDLMNEVFEFVTAIRRGDEHNGIKRYLLDEVIPETVGQYTGLTDKNGKKIFEGDIVKGTFFGFPMPIENYVFTIGWQEDVAGYKANYFENVEIVGNIHDNPELLKGGAE